MAVTGQCIEISQLAQCPHRLHVSDEARGYFSPPSNDHGYESRPTRRVESPQPENASTFFRGDPAQLLPSAHLRHLSRSDAVRAQASVDVGSVITLFSEFGHEGMMGR
jgi:hypothetical protein